MSDADAAERYHSLPDPSRADHLWRYTTLLSMHPESDLEHLPHTDSAKVEVTGAAFEFHEGQPNSTFAGTEDKGVALSLIHI